MESKRSFEDFEPFCKWRKEEQQSILEVHLQGFKKEQLRIQVNRNGVLTISGERPLDGTKSCSFRKTINIPRDCRADGIHAKFSSGSLYVTLPKKYRASRKQNDQSTEPMNQPETSAGMARRFITALKDLVLRPEMSRHTARRLGVAVGVAIAVTVGAIVAYKIRQSLHA